MQDSHECYLKHKMHWIEKGWENPYRQTHTSETIILKLSFKGMGLKSVPMSVYAQIKPGKVYIHCTDENTHEPSQILLKDRLICFAQWNQPTQI